jgi:REP element-mobilizing transposase RayT
MIAHVTMRGNDRRKIFLDDVDYATFLRMLREVQAQFGWTLHTYCLMPNHYHTAIGSDDSLAKGMHLLNGRYARRFNVRHGRTGHVFEGPYDPKPVESDEHFEECCRYIAENPVRAGLCATSAEWPWSGGDTYECHRHV